jgi:hypothetical protein
MDAPYRTVGCAGIIMDTFLNVKVGTLKFGYMPGICNGPPKAGTEKGFASEDKIDWIEIATKML